MEDNTAGADLGGGMQDTGSSSQIPTIAGHRHLFAVRSLSGAASTTDDEICERVFKSCFVLYLSGDMNSPVLNQSYEVAFARRHVPQQRVIARPRVGKNGRQPLPQHAMTVLIFLPRKMKITAQGEPPQTIND